MGAWANLDLSDATLAGIAPTDLTDPDLGAVDGARLTSNYLSQAKRYIQMRLMKELPRAVHDADGPVEFMDAAAGLGKTHIDDLLQNMLAYSFLMHYYDQEAMGREDIMLYKLETAAAKFNLAFDAFVKSIVLDDDFVDASEATTDNDMDRYKGPIFIG